jgi:hypothetical protein
MMEILRRPSFVLRHFPHRTFSFSTTRAVKSNVNGETETTWSIITARTSESGSGV